MRELAEIEAKKSQLLDARSSESGLGVARAVQELLDTEGYSFRQFDLGLVWGSLARPLQVPLVAAALVAPVGLALAPWMAGDLGWRYPAIGLRLVLPLASAAVAVLTMRTVVERLAGAPARGPAEAVRRNLGLVVAAVAVQIGMTLLESLPRALLLRWLPIHTVGLLSFQMAMVLMGMGFFWWHLHVWSELALSGASAFGSLVEGTVRALGNALGLPGALLRVPGVVRARLRGEPTAGLGPGDLAMSMVIVYGAGALVGTFLGVLFSLVGGWVVPGGPVQVGYALVNCLLVAAANLGILSLGLGRWCFFDLAERYRRLSPAAAVPALREGP